VDTDSLHKALEIVFAPAVTQSESNEYALRIPSKRQLPRASADARKILFDEQLFDQHPEQGG